MTWHLKDRELEKKLIAIDPEFLKGLNGAVDDFLCDFSYLDTNKTISFMFCKADLTELGELYFFLSDLEEIPEYNPNAWNEYPKVTPPIDVIMRVEFRSSTEGAKAYWDGTYWMRCRSTSCSCDSVIQRDIERFRPWE